MDQAMPVVLRRSRWRVLPGLLVGLLFAVFGVAVIVSALQSASAGVVAVVVILFAPASGVGLLAVVRTAPDLLVPRDRIWITDQGFKQAVLHPHVLLPWAAITDVSVVSRGKGVKTVAVGVRDADLVLHRWRAVRHLQQNRWFVRLVRLWLVSFAALEGPAGAKDAVDAARADLTPAATFELPMGGFPIKAQQLAELMRERQRHCVAARAQQESEAQDPAPMAPEA